MQSQSAETELTILRVEPSRFSIMFYFIFDVIKYLVVKLKIVLLDVVNEIDSFDHSVIEMTNAYAFICQIVFFTLSDAITPGTYTYLPTNRKLPRGPYQYLGHLHGPITLLFYTIFTYFISKVRDMNTNNFNNNNGNIYDNDLTSRILKIFIEWSKAAVIVVCLKEQGIRYKPAKVYTITTFVYYMCTEKTFVELIPQLVQKLNFVALDSMEHLYVPLVMYSYAIGAGCAVVAIALYDGIISYSIVAAYFTIYLRTKDAFKNYVPALTVQLRLFDYFRVATEKEIREWNDICAVCLNEMTKASVTPCNHLFHPHCLRMCLKNSLKCPLCKANFY